MHKLSFVFILLSLSYFSTGAAYAQGIPVMDVAHIAMTVANGATLQDQLEKIEDQLEVSERIEETVNDIYQLQDDYQESLKQAEKQCRTYAGLIW